VNIDSWRAILQEGRCKLCRKLSPDGPLPQQGYMRPSPKAIDEYPDSSKEVPLQLPRNIPGAACRPCRLPFRLPMLRRKAEAALLLRDCSMCCWWS
jgi:hypothetical protein